MRTLATVLGLSLAVMLLLSSTPAFVPHGAAQTPPAAPELQVPAPGEIVTTLTPAFDWATIREATGYRFEIATSDATNADGRFADPLFSTSRRVSSFSLKTPLRDGKSYVWHVLAVYPDGTLVASENRAFTVALPTTATPTPTASPLPPTPSPTPTTQPPTPTPSPTAVPPTPTPSPTAVPPSPTATPRQSRYVYERASKPARTIVTSRTGIWVATFTDGARTVALKGPERTFSEATAAYPVVHSVWVRLLPEAFGGTVDESWLDRALSDSSPDILALSMQYVTGSPDRVNDAGLRIAGDASYGPLRDDGTRNEGSDFNDFMGIPWFYGNYADQPEADQIGAMDCSGFVRMVYGYRAGYPLTQSGNGAGLPRTSSLMLAAAPGIVTIPHQGAQVTTFTRLQPGDLVFFDISSDDDGRIDHVGIFLGQDAAGNYRFISSRKRADGPTLGDFGGRSILNGTGTYATGYRAARRL